MFADVPLPQRRVAFRYQLPDRLVILDESFRPYPVLRVLYEDECVMKL